MMRLLRRHPDLLALERFVAGDASARESRKIARHLRECDRCRVRARWLRTLPEDIESATRPPLPEGVEERILARRAAGDRVILPAHESQPRARLPGVLRHSGAAAAALTVLMLLGGLFFFRTRELGALWSELIFDPAEPGPGERVEVTYRPDPELADEPWLVLRGRVTGPVDYAVAPPGPRRLTVLRPSGGTYRGSFTLDEDAVYAQLAVEDSAGATVDDRGGRLWHLHAHRSGRPTPEALRAHALLATDWEDAQRIIERATRLYPRNPRFHAARLARELEVLPQAARDSALADHRERFQSLARSHSDEGQLTAETLVGLVEYASTIGDTAAAREWTTRLLERYPDHSEAIWYRVPPPPDNRDDASLRSYLVELESLWRDTEPHPAISGPGFWAASQLEDSAAVLRWAEREAGHTGLGEEVSRHILHSYRGASARVALALAEVPVLRRPALDRLRETIVELDHPHDSDRPLDQTTPEDERQRREAMRPLLAQLGELLLLEEEQREAALDTLRLAASIGWNPSLHRRVAELELAAGDTVSAAMSLARAAASRFNRDAAEADEELEVAPGADLVSPDEWDRMRRAAQDEMYRSVLSRSESRELRVRPVYLFDSQGERYTLRGLSHRTVTLVAFWNPWCGPAQRELPRLRQLTYLVRALGGEAIVITEEPPSERLSAVLGEHEGTIPLYHDLDRRASAAFQQYGSPEYFILGFDGRIRFARTDLDDVIAEMDALLNEPRLTAAATETRR